MMKQHNILNKLKFKLLTLHFLLSTMVFAQWLSVEESNITLAPGESVTINITANASGYELGDYEGTIQITSNDPENPSIDIPVSMSVLYPIGGVEAESIDFGEAGFNSINNYQLPITNGGNYPLEVNSSFSVGYSEFDILNDSLTVQPGDTGFVDIQLTTGLEEMDLADTLILSMNDPSLSHFFVPLSAIVVPSVHPIITDIIDVPNDQGGMLTIEFTRSVHDTSSLRNPELYTIEMNIGEGWTASNSLVAYGEERYNAYINTPFDSSATSVGVIDFRVIAGMDEGNFASDVVTGYSVDNINPSTPDDVMASVIDNNVNISWNYTQDIDFNYHQTTQLWDSPVYTIQNEVNIPLSASYNEYFTNSIDIHDNHSAKSDYVGAHDLHEGANLVSFSVLPDNNSISNVIMGDVSGVIGEGVAGNYIPNIGWVGSLTEIEPDRGYWIKTNTEFVHLNIGEKLYVENYDLHIGANLISYTCSGEGSLTELIEADCIEGIIGEGVAASQNDALGWVGSLTDLIPGKGYWFKTTEACEISYDCPEASQGALVRYPNEIIEDYIQSTEQAFYFIEDIESIEVGDIVSAYCNNTKVGERVWNGSYTDIPTMGVDSSDLTKDYCTSNSVPTFNVEKLNGEMYSLTGNIASWESNGLLMVGSMGMVEALPENYNLAPAYPNPFNPTTTISFAIPIDSKVEIKVYNIQGSEVATIVNSYLDGGYHSITWDASNFASGVYFVKMIAGSYVENQKIVLVK